MVVVGPAVDVSELGVSSAHVAALAGEVVVQGPLARKVGGIEGGVVSPAVAEHAEPGEGELIAVGEVVGGTEAEEDVVAVVASLAA